MPAFNGIVKLTAHKGYIEVVREDAVKGGAEYNAAEPIEIAKAALKHAKALKVKIKAFAPDVEPTSVGPKGETLFSAAKLEKITQVPVVLKAKSRPLPYLAFLAPLPAKGAGGAAGLGEAKAAKPKAEPQGL